MASSRPGGFKKGGGFLNNVDGSISDYEFTPDFPGSEGKDKKKGASDFNPLYFVLTADVDGKDEAQTTTMLAGSADDFEIEDGGKTLNPVDDKVGLRQGTPFARFLETLVGKGFPETLLPEDDEPINYEAILGTRVRFEQEIDTKSMEKAAKNWRKSNGKFNEQGQKKGKDGKFYNQTLTVVAEVYSLPGESEQKVAPVKGKTAAAGKAVTTTKPAGGKANGKAVDIAELAAQGLLEILNENDGSIAKSKLPGRIAAKYGPKHPHREDIRKVMFSDDFLSQEGLGWSYDQSSKNQTISVA